MKKILLFSWLICMILFSGCIQPTAKYGVFLGIDQSQKGILEAYQTIVIEPEEFSDQQIDIFHQQKKTVYAYINIGALEEYRVYFHTYEMYALDPYKGWPDEYWMDISAEQWQQFLIHDLAAKYAAMGFDGFFVDNTDVYANYPTDRIYQGVLSVLKGLKNYDLPLIINGGDIFLKRVIAEGNDIFCFDAVNQESVFTSFSFEDNSCHLQNPAETEYYKSYLQTIKEAGKKIYLLEYGADQKTTQQIQEYCLQNDFQYFISADRNLTKPN